MKQLAVAGAFLLLLGASAAAQDQAPQNGAAQNGAPQNGAPQNGAPQNGAAMGSPDAETGCGSDTQRFCKTVTPGGGRKIACLKAHMKELSPTCRAALPSLKASSPSSAPPN